MAPDCANMAETMPRIRGTTLDNNSGTPRGGMTVNRREATMRHDDKDHRQQLNERLETEVAEKPNEDHVVFDFTGLEQANVADLSLILTARLQSAPTDSVWVRSLPWRTAQVLKFLRLDHLFRHYPEAEGLAN